MKKLLKRITLTFFTLLFIFGAILPNFSASKVQAAGVDDLWIHQWYGETNPLNWYAKVYDTSNPSEIFGERYTAAQVQWVMYGVFSMFWNLIPGNPDLTICIVGGDLTNCQALLIKYQNIILQMFGLPKIPGTAASSSSGNLAMSIINTVDQNPISSIAYFKDFSSRFSLVTPVKAQGFGYSTAGNSIIPLWRITRNISYSFIIIAVIILSFMIMFRVKISPQVVISVQSAIPKLVIALVLITFSYAIAGLLVDLMYVIIGVLAMFITSGGLSSETATGLFNLFTHFYGAFGLLWLYWLQFVWTMLKSIGTSGLGGAIPAVFGFLLAIIAVIAILWWSIKIIWMLIKNYAMLILTIVIGPLEILLGTVTQSTGFGTWFKKLMSYLAVYPLMALLFFLSFFFLNQGVNGGADATFWMPFLPTANVVGLNTWTPPFSALTAGTGGLVWVFVSFFIFSQITNITKIIQGFISGKPFDYGTGIGEAVGVSTNLARGGLSAGVNKYEEKRAGFAKGSGTAYTPSALSGFLRTTGIIKGH